MSGKARISRAGLSYFLLNQDLKTRLLISERRPRAEHDDIVDPRAYKRRARIQMERTSVARCTAPGLRGNRAARRPYGASWRDQTSHIPLRMRLCPLSINGCEESCQILQLY